MFTKNKGAESDKTVTNKMTGSPSQDAIRGASSKASARAASIICSDMKINGAVSSEGAIHIDGVIEGNVSAADVVVGASGSITGEIQAEVVKVRGKIKGSIRARKVELETGAHVEGDIVHASLQIQQNAVFQGQVKHSDKPLNETGPKAANAKQTAATSSKATPSAFGTVGNS